ncbi:hypothetical protein ASD24_24635 [Paenibacillus sp. Root52]|uniref:hypothetical protein n=1 Tax=Paenibacillus sp. Root52 TaxID=1736552 RepID=UPI0006F97CC1|nr:hypothetical protein [Paenibacillus sp. Root52]KQY90986.1 hypothetical protein ASD24_24635 [Paenibacillus sp. Root52]
MEKVQLKNPSPLAQILACTALMLLILSLVIGTYALKINIDQAGLKSQLEKQYSEERGSWSWGQNTAAQ